MTQKTQKPAVGGAKRAAPAAKKAAAKTKRPAAKQAAVVRSNRLKASAAAVRRRLTLRTALVTVGALAVLALAALLMQNASVARDPQQPATDAKSVQEQLRGQVENPNGTPLTGRDPASQKQGSLAAAAASPNGAGARTDKPAADVDDDHSHHEVSHGDVYGDPKQTGIGSNGCYIDYGTQGEQCLPAHAAGDDKKLTCDDVRKYFADGISVVGTDRFHLDHNGDTLACGRGE